MELKEIIISGRNPQLHKAFISPDFAHKTVLVRDYWDYVGLVMRRKRNSKASFYWSQARNFYESSLNLPNVAAPLPLYYSFLNATKALLSYKSISFTEWHGVRGTDQGGDTNLKNEIIEFKTQGILGALCNYLGDPATPNSHALKGLLYNLPFIHRCFNITFPSGYQEIYIPISKARFLVDPRQKDVFFVAELTDNYANGHTFNKLTPLGFTKLSESNDRYVISKAATFKWSHKKSDKGSNLTNLIAFHKSIRGNAQYISGPNTLWYLKRGDAAIKHGVNRHPLSIMFAAMHRLSELARYNPLKLEKHFTLSQNWLLSEFIKGSPTEFFDQISCEITNQNFMQPAVRTSGS